MATYIQITNALNRNLLTGGSGAAQESKLTMEPPPNPDLNIQLDGQKWSFLPDPAGAGAYWVLDPAEAALEIPVISLTQDGDPMRASTLAVVPTQLWYLFADPQGSVNESGQPNCFLTSGLCMVPNYEVIDHFTVQLPAVYAKTMEVKGGSRKAGATVEAVPIKSEAYSSTPTQAYARQLWSPAAGQLWPILPVSMPPNTGLQGNSNYFMGNYVVDIVRSAKVVVVIDEDLICDDGVGFQLNCFGGATGSGEVWQQYVVLLKEGDTSLNCLVNNWTLQEYTSWAGGGPGQLPLVYDETQLCSLPNPFLPAGTTITIELDFDPHDGTITAVTFKARGPNGSSGEPLFSGSVYVDVATLPAIPGNVLGYQLLVVGPANGAYTSFIGGSGTIRYESSELFSVSPSLGFQYAWDSGTPAFTGGTGEDSNMHYSFLPPSTISPSTTLIQTFNVTGH